MAGRLSSLRARWNKSHMLLVGGIKISLRVFPNDQKQAPSSATDLWLVAARADLMLSL